MSKTIWQKRKQELDHTPRFLQNSTIYHVIVATPPRHEKISGKFGPQDMDIIQTRECYLALGMKQMDRFLEMLYSADFKDFAFKTSDDHKLMFIVDEAREIEEKRRQQENPT